MRFMKRCNETSCRELIERGQTYCSEHKGETDKQYNKWRNKYDKEATDFYKSSRWRRTRKSVLREQQYLCQDCLEFEGIYNPADVVDHIVELKDDWSKRLDPDNLRAICHTHHNQKTAREARRRKDR